MKFSYFQLCVFGVVFVAIMAFPKKLYGNTKPLLVKDKLKLYRDQLSQKLRLDSGRPKILKVEDEKRDEFFTIENRPYELHKINKHLRDELYQGDIALTHDQIDNLIIAQKEEENGRDKRQAYKPASYPNTLWKKNGINYRIASSIDSTTAQKIRKAIKFWQDNTCLTFKENGPDAHFLNFYKGSGCWSYIGNVSSFTQQDISIGEGCEQVGIIEHEIGHALGFFHTQSRYDRDSFVKIDTSNIDSSMLDNFDKESSSTNDNFGLEYDYGSVMHYSENAFAMDENKPVISSLTSKLYQKTMGNRIEPSFTDILMMNKLYQCTNVCASSTFKCYNQGFNNPSNCNKCICPGGFGGDNCGYRKLASNGTESCGENLQATTEWKSLDRIIGNGQQQVIDEVTTCHWFLVAPVGKHVEIKVDYIGRICSSGCFYGGTEFKLGNFTKTGYRMCCKADYENLSTLTSQQHLAIICAIIFGGIFVLFSFYLLTDKLFTYIPTPSNIVFLLTWSMNAFVLYYMNSQNPKYFLILFNVFVISLIIDIILFVYFMVTGYHSAQILALYFTGTRVQNVINYHFLFALLDGILVCVSSMVFTVIILKRRATSFTSRGKFVAILFPNA